MPRPQHNLLKRFVLLVMIVPSSVALVAGIITYNLHSGSSTAENIIPLLESLDATEPAPLQTHSGTSFMETIGYGIGALILGFLLVIVSSAIYQLTGKGGE